MTTASESAKEATQALKEMGTGYWRMIAVEIQRGTPKKLGLSASEWVREEIGGSVKLALGDRIAASMELEAAGMSNRQTAAALGVDEGTIRGDKKRAENSASGESDGAENSAPVESGAEEDKPKESKLSEEEERARAFADTQRSWIKGLHRLKEWAGYRVQPVGDDYIDWLLDPETGGYMEPPAPQELEIVRQSIRRIINRMKEKARDGKHA